MNDETEHEKYIRLANEWTSAAVKRTYLPSAMRDLAAAQVYATLALATKS